MDISSSLEPRAIECNVPVIKGNGRQVPLLVEGYETNFTTGLESELGQAKEKKQIEI